MFCPTCGSPISDDAKFCPVCGSAVGAASAAAAPQPQPAPAQTIQPAPQPQQQYTGQYARQSASAPMDYGPVKADRSLIGWLLLSLVTCGIYSFYFLYCLARDINVMCQDDGDSTPGLAAFILLSFVTAASTRTTGITRLATACRPTLLATAWYSRKTAPPFFCGRSSACCCAVLAPSLP